MFHVLFILRCANFIFKKCVFFALVICSFHLNLLHSSSNKKLPIFAVEDLDLDGIESLKGQQYLAIGKHLCGPATGKSYSYR